LTQNEKIKEVIKNTEKGEIVGGKYMFIVGHTTSLSRILHPNPFKPSQAKKLYRGKAHVTLRLSA